MACRFVAGRIASVSCRSWSETLKSREIGGARDGRRAGTSSTSRWFRDSPESTMVFRRQTESDLGPDFASIRFGGITALLDRLRPLQKTTSQCNHQRTAAQSGPRWFQNYSPVGLLNTRKEEEICGYWSRCGYKKKNRVLQLVQYYHYWLLDF